jgi:hypothetical protein
MPTYQYWALAVMVAGVALSTPGFAVAAKAPEVITFEQVSPAEIAQIVAGWHDKFEAGEVLLNARKADAYEDELKALMDKLVGIENWDGFNAQARVDLANDYEALRAQTDRGEAAGNRRICSFEKRRGSNMRTTVCVTAAEQKRIDALNKSVLDDIGRNGRRETIPGR